MHRFPDRLRPFTLVLAVSAFAVLSASWPVSGTGISWTALLVFALLAVATGRERVPVGDGIELTPGFMVSMAAVVVFHSSAVVAGPMIVAALTAVHPDDLRPGRRGWVVLNGSIFALGAAAAAIVYDALPERIVQQMPLGIVAVVPVAVVICVVEAVLVAASHRVEQGRSIQGALAEVAPSILRALPFAVVGLFLGQLYSSVGWPVVLLLVVPIVLQRDLFESYRRVRDANEATMRVLIRALEAKDSYTAGHAERVARYAQFIGEEFGFRRARLERLRHAALMHDIGKLVVPNQLLNKPGRLTAEEFAVVRAHEAVSVEVLGHVDFLRPIARAAGGDHSRFDPNDRARLVESSIIAVADAYDAMTSTRSYRRALRQEVAFDELRAKAGTQFDPACVEALVRAIEWRGERHGDGHEVASHPWATAPPGAGVGSAGLGDLIDGIEPT